jgi:four helix bundle protein
VWHGPPADHHRQPRQDRGSQLAEAAPRATLKSVPSVKRVQRESMYNRRPGARHERLSLRRNPEQPKERTMKVADYEELRVCRLAFESAVEIFEVSCSWPAKERYSPTDLIWRSARSVCTNIGEAWRKRRYEAAFISKLSDSDGEAAETMMHLDLTSRCGYLPPDRHAQLRDHYDHICCQLARMTDDAASWCGSGCELRELPPKYIAGPRSDAADASTL